MNGKLATAFTTVISVLALAIPAQAQSPETTDTLKDGYTVQGDSLTGIDNRTSLEDFSKFFPTNNNPVSTKTNTALPLNQQINLPNFPIILQPARLGMIMMVCSYSLI
ncbi:MAG: hypothetical protein HC908_06935 [Calothrix sp. SM1_7_51]|nr:hypothetical protein [Calothrix sp. SM1_7_51]